MWSKYGKSIAAGAMLIVTAVQAALSDSHLTQAEELQIAIAVTTTLSVYFAPNMPRWPWCKTVLAALGAGLTVAVTLVDNGISPADWTAVILGALTVVTVGAAPAPVHRLVPAMTVTGSMPTTRNTGVFDGPQADGPKELR